MKHIPQLTVLFIIAIAFVQATTLTTFGDGSSSGNLSFLTGFEWHTKEILIPPNANVTNAILYLNGFYTSNVTTNYTTQYLHDFETDPYANWSVNNRYNNITQVPSSKTGGYDSFVGEINGTYNFWENFSMNFENYTLLNISLYFKFVGTPDHLNGAHWYVTDQEQSLLRGVDLIWLQTGLSLQHYDGTNYTEVCTWTYTNESSWTKLTIELNNTGTRTTANFWCNDTKLYAAQNLPSYTGGKPTNLTQIRIGTASAGSGFFYVDNINVSYPGVANSSTVFIYPTNVSLILNNASTVFNYGAANATGLDHQILANFTSQLNHPIGYPQNLSFRSNTSGLLEYTGILISFTYENYSLQVNYTPAVRINGTNYTRSTPYTIQASCNAGDTATINVLLNNIVVKDEALSCTGSMQTINGNISASTEGNHTLSFYLNDTTSPAYNQYALNQTFFWDLYNPTVIADFAVTPGIANTTTQARCNDSAYYLLFNNVSFNGARLIEVNLTNMTLVSNFTNITTGANTLDVFCHDLFGYTNLSVTRYGYLTSSNTTVLFTIKDDDSGLNIEGASMLMQQWINATWVSVDSQLSDVTGRVQFLFEPGEKYRFMITMTGYATKVFELDPILFSSYFVMIRKSTAYENDIDYFGVSMIYSPHAFVNNEWNNLTFIISSPASILTSYGVNVTFPNGTSITQTRTGTNVQGEQFNFEFNISGATLTSKVIIDYFYVSTYGQRRTFRVSHGIQNYQASQGTWLANRRQTYGMGLFERMLIVILTTLIVAGFINLIAGSEAAGAGGLLVMGFMAYILAINFFLIAISILVGIVIIARRSSE